MKKLFRFLLAAFFFFAGANHFLNPEFYLPLIPPYFPFPDLINVASGLIEMILAIGVVVQKTVRLAAWGIVALLIAFIPSHVYFIQVGSCISDGLCVPPWVGWARLVVVHPIFIGWAYLYTKT